MSESKAWLYVIIAGMLEIIWASGFKYEAIPTLLVIVSILGSFDLLIRSTKTLPVGTVYAVFAGMGTIGTTIVEIVFSGEPVSPLRITLILVLLASIVGLKLTSKESEG